MSATTTIDLVWVINGLAGLLVLILGTLVGNIWLEIKALRAAKHHHTTELSALKILIVGDYVKREELKDLMREVTSELRTGFQQIEHKMESNLSQLYDELKNKADKH